MKVLIIGASRGLGLEFARQLCAGGHEVWASYRRRQDGDALEGLGCRALRLDVCDAAEFQACAEAVSDVALDWVILNAGFNNGRSGAREAPQRDDFDRVMQTNVESALRAVALFGPQLEKGGGTFTAISSNMASIGGLESSMGLLYRCSKAALNMVIRAAALEFPGATFLAQSPGWVRTNMGGPEAPLGVEESVRRMIEILRSSSLEDSGSFKDIEGRALPF